MNKFLTILLALLLVDLFSGLVWGEMTETNVVAEPPSPPTRTLSGLPVVLEFSRFSALSKKSPFTLASTTEEAADFAKELVLAGFVRLEGEDFIMVANKTKPDRILVGKKPSPSARGLLLVEVKKDPSGDPAKMEARIKKGTEFATLKYEATGGATPTPPAGAGGIPAVPIPNPPGMPGIPGQGSPIQAGGVPNKNPNPPVIRRRVVPIPGKAGK